ncbi:trypsin-like serine protease [Catenovulum sp. SM1970]|uniref:trypsin-like serine protease n=1 Tax=Marinifaba aquimaris TaxID=2741323 RepID=UPI001574D66F|nr:trypsin-like serine protease [Marinifaba aquimaris]NTS78782.1 trypsin-like serine protease [Marinifaba aquimaris]
MKIFYSIAIFSLLLAIVLQAKAEQPSRVPVSIIGGDIAEPERWPYMVALVSKNSSPFFGQFCGGTLLTEKVVLTAAHCVADKSAMTIEVYIGAADLNQARQNSDRRSVSQIVVHPNYFASQNQNDIALLFLSQASYRETMSYATPDIMQQVDNGDELRIAGWGTTDPDGDDYPSLLNDVTVPFVSQSRCNRSLSGLITDDMFCSGLDEGGKDSCYGDSGGPVIGNVGGQDYIMGVVSWGIGCAQAGLYGVNAKVSHFSDWIAQNIQNKLTSDLVSQLQDSQLQACVIQNAQINGWQSISEITSLSCANQNINQLDGIGLLTELESIDLSSNNITNLAPLAGLENINALNVTNNDILDIRPLLGLSQLTSIELGQNELYCLGAESGFSSINQIPNNCWQDPFIDTDNDGFTDVLESLVGTGINDATDTPTLISSINFSDFNLARCVERQSKNLKYAEQITSLNCSNWEISNLTGLSAFINLTYLNLTANEITDIAELSALNQLSVLDIANNQVLTLDINPNWPKLTSLFLSGNILEQVPVSGITWQSIESLSVSYSDALLVFVPLLDSLVRLELTAFEQAQLNLFIESLPIISPWTHLDIYQSELEDIDVLSNADRLTNVGIYFSTIDSMRSLVSLSNLAQLRIQNTSNLDKVSLAELKTESPALELILFDNADPSCAAFSNYYQVISALPNECLGDLGTNDESSQTQAVSNTSSATTSQSSSEISRQSGGGSGGGSLAFYILSCIVALSYWRKRNLKC